MLDIDIENHLESDNERTSINKIILMYNKSVTIKSGLRPDYYEYFPRFQAIELEARFKYLEFPEATMLSTYNIILAVKHQKKIKFFNEFINLDFHTQRKLMCKILEGVGVNKKVAGAINKVEREIFCPYENTKKFCYLNTSLFFDKNSCVSSPGIVGLMINQVVDNIEKPRRILEIGVGSGYHACCMSQYYENEIIFHGIDINDEYLSLGQKNIQHTGLKNITLYNNYNKIKNSNHKYDVIYYTAALTEFPSEIIKLLNPNGLLQIIAPISFEEYETESKSSIIKRKYLTYDAYLNDLSQFNYLKVSCYKLVENTLQLIDSIYDVQFVPFRQNKNNGSLDDSENKFDPGCNFSELLNVLNT